MDLFVAFFFRGIDVFKKKFNILICKSFGITIFFCSFSISHLKYFNILKSYLNLRYLFHYIKKEMQKAGVFTCFLHLRFFLYPVIAGTYTPIALCTLRKESTALGWSYFGIIWTLAAVGVLLNAVDLKKFRVLSMILYLGMGWCIIWAFPGVYRAVGTGGTALLLIGGLCYTLGAVLYGLGKKHAYIHSVFHLFIVFGSILHFLFILFYVM